MAKLTTQEFIDRARQVHGDKYDYSKAVYTKSHGRICVICPKHGEFWPIAREHIGGHICMQCWLDQKVGRECIGNRKGVCGHGILDVDFASTKSVEVKTAYKTWHAMLRRCYENGGMATYKDCTVCEEWFMFSNFKKWFEQNYVKGYALDKDILVKGNKVYSPSTCCFVPSRINSLLVNAKKHRGDLPLGVCYDKERQKYLAGGSSIKPKRFCTAEEAFCYYKQEKEKYIKEVAQEYYNKGLITEKVYNALMNYKVEITD